MLATQIVQQAHLAILVALTALALSENVQAQEALAERAIGGRSSKTYTFTQRACTTLLGSKAVRPVPTATTTKLSATVGFPIFEYARPTITVTPAATTTTTTTTVTSTSTVNNPANTDTATETDTVTTTTTVTQTSTTQTQLPEVTITTTVTPTTYLVLPNFTPAASAPGLQGHTYARRGLEQLEAARIRIPRSLRGSSRADSLHELAARGTRQMGPRNALQYSNKKKCYPQSVKCKKAIEKVAVTTYTVAGKRTVTRAAPGPTSTSEVTTTVTSTKTIQPSDATTTVTVTTTNTQTSTTSTTTTETLPATTRTETAQAPRITVNNACQANNFIRRVDGLDIVWVTYDESAATYSYTSGSSAEACCLQCASSATCLSFVYEPTGYCNMISTEGRCSANEKGSTYYGRQNIGEAAVVGSGPCGYADYGGQL